MAKRETFETRAGVEKYVDDPAGPSVKEQEANAEVAAEDRSDDVKCDNHPQRKARTFTGGGAYEINLCDECTPPWFKDEASSEAL